LPVANKVHGDEHLNRGQLANVAETDSPKRQLSAGRLAEKWMKTERHGRLIRHLVTNLVLFDTAIIQQADEYILTWPSSDHKIRAFKSGELSKMDGVDNELAPLPDAQFRTLRNVPKAEDL
jgi:hypothetical protein